MGATPLMSLGIRAMAANFAALQATGNNIANANVDGYSRQQVLLSTSPGQFTGAGFFGRGVDVTGVSRMHDAFLTREAAGAISTSAMDSTRLAQLEQLETVFKTGESGLGHAASQLFSAFSDLASHPGDLSARQVVLARANDLADRVNEAYTALDDLQRGVTSTLKSQAADINSLASAIASANREIATLEGTGQEPNDLKDKRDRLVAQLSERVQLTRVDAADGTVGLFIGGGQRIVLGGEAGSVSVVPDPDDATRSALALNAGDSTVTIDASTLGGGSVAGLLRFQNEDLVAGRALIEQFASSMTSTLNTQHEAGADLQGDTGQPLFSLQSGVMAVLVTDPHDLAAATPGASDLATSNGNALALVALRDQAFVDGDTATDFWAGALADIGVRVQTAQSSADISAAVAEQAEATRSSHSGVNLDEEAARLIQYQQSYQAAAKVLQVAQSVFDTLLQTAGR